jgi:hypothetical protein
LLKSVERLQRAAVQRLQLGVLDAVLAVDLLGDQLGVVDDLDRCRADRGGALEPQQERAVLGDVVGRVADRHRGLVEHPAVGRRDDRGGGRGTRVAAGAAVHVDDDLHAAEVYELPLVDGAIGGNSPGTRGLRRSRTSRCPPPVEPGSRRSDLRRSTITVTFGSLS